MEVDFFVLWYNWKMREKKFIFVLRLLKYLGSWVLTSLQTGHFILAGLIDLSIALTSSALLYWYCAFYFLRAQSRVNWQNDRKPRYFIIMIAFLTDFCFCNFKKKNPCENEENWNRIKWNKLILARRRNWIFRLCVESQRGAVPSCKLELNEIISLPNICFFYLSYKKPKGASCKTLKSIQLNACVVFAGAMTTSLSSICKCCPVPLACFYKKCLTV